MLERPAAHDAGTRGLRACEVAGLASYGGGTRWRRWQPGLASGRGESHLLAEGFRAAKGLAREGWISRESPRSGAPPASARRKAQAEPEGTPREKEGDGNAALLRPNSY